MTAPPRPNPADVTRRRAFARSHVDDAARRGPVPTYGSPEWHRLPYDDPRRWAAVLVAAECWAADGDDIPARLRRELADQAAAAEAVEDEAFAAMAANIRRHAGSPSHAELQRRRAS